MDKIRGAQDQAQQAMAGAGQGQSGMPAGMGGMDMGAQAAYAQMAQKLAQSGVEAPGVIHSIRPTGETDMGGGQRTEFDVSIRPADGGDPFQTTISQSMLPAQMEDLSEGKSITVKYDPDSPTSALIYGW
ncbi:MAG TPA: DUF3592 domain-containing protein [Thermoleophilaceae bacterium]|jgi:hypothetical protein